MIWINGGVLLYPAGQSNGLRKEEMNGTGECVAGAMLKILASVIMDLPLRS